MTLPLQDLGNILVKTNSNINKKACIIQRNCPLCNHSQAIVFFDIEKMPVFCNILWDSREEAISAPTASIRLIYCKKCGLIYNMAFEPQLMEYCQAYENSLHFSPRFRKYTEKIANQLIDRYQLRDKNIIEIGCGQGDFLTLLCEVGGNRGIGFDPSYTPQKNKADSENSKVTIFPEAYSRAHAEYEADFFCCRHVLEHIDNPLEFLKQIRNAIDQQNDCVVYFEVPNALYTLRDTGIWDIIYEHCSYFTPESLTNLFIQAGFEPMEVAEQYDGQFLTIEARPTTTDTNSIYHCEFRCPNTENLIREFYNIYQKKVDLWQQKLRYFEKEKSRVVIWGAGSKGVTFLNKLSISYRKIEYIIDINSRKHGKFIAGTGQKVAAPDFLKVYQPHVIIIMNPIYYSEIQQAIRNLGINAECVVT